MPQILYTIEEYITEQRKKDSIWMVFNTRYNELHALHHVINEEDTFGYYDKHFTDEAARASFLTFMKENFPEISLVEVFDLVGIEWLQWPYLGSIAIDADVGSTVYNALCEKYGNAYDDPKDTNQALWVMEYKDAKKWHEKRSKAIDEEFGDDE
ncbi:MAG: hypothetical protein EOM50_17240 [Erysipelotrichia bacterium]|nr:hypothetical protein [Erysipelotrichia bacterium]NCC55481.1 hypothetical protein [Erysipelotrichia bacterium]